MSIAIVGTGLVGSGWAIVFARAGFPVALYDRAAGAAERALSAIGERLTDLEAAGLIDDPAGIHARIRLASGLADAVQGARYIQESVLEDVAVKQSVMSEIDAVIGPTRGSAAPRPASRLRSIPSTSPADRAAWSPIPLTRPIWRRSSNWCPRHGRRRIPYAVCVR